MTLTETTPHMTPESQLSRRHFLAGVGLAGAYAALPALPGKHSHSGGAPFVLVHGAWHGGWCWRRVVDQLTAQGHYVTAPTLSGVGERSHLASDAITLSTQVDDVVNEITWKDLDRVVLVGHSYAGMVITGVAERIHERLAAIVYLDAFLPADGQSLFALLGPNATPFPVPMTPTLPAAYFVNGKDAAWVASKLTPHPTKCFTEALHVTDAYQKIPTKCYIRAPAFKQPSFDAAYARCRADRAWKTFEMSGGHDVMLDQPGELVAILNGLV